MFRPEVSGRRLDPAELRAIALSLMADPETRRIIVHELLGPLFPIQGGTCGTTASQVSSGRFGGDCSDAGDYTFDGKVGIGTASPGQQLEIYGNSNGSLASE